LTRGDLPLTPLREQRLAWAAIVLASGLSWLYLLQLGAGMDSGRAMDMASMAMQRPWTLLEAWLMFLMWAVMMVAMMLPSASPMILLYQRIAHQKMSRSRLSVTLFASGYLLVWTGFSAVATAAQWALREIGLVNDMMVSSSGLLSGTLLVAAGLYQLSPWKQTCLYQCQTPFYFIMQHWRGGPAGALQMGLHHGGFCLGCCWLVMALLFVGGVMNLLWIALLALFVLVEKALTGVWPTRASAVVLLVGGTWMLWSAKL
jgi:predicted metal-binding membrane protein